MGHYSDYYAREAYESQKGELEQWLQAKSELENVRYKTMPNAKSMRITETWDTFMDMVTARIAVLQQHVKSYEEE